MLNSDDDRLGQLLRVMRRRAGLIQERLAQVAGVPMHDLTLLEAGLGDRVKLGRSRALFAAAGGALRTTAWFNGATADRLIDERHAALVERTTALLRRRGWETLPEVSFSEFGERGSIALLGAHAATRCAAVCEIKTAFGSLEATNRQLDVKIRLAPKICERVLGWRPRHIGRLLIVPDESTYAASSADTRPP